MARSSFSALLLAIAVAPSPVIAQAVVQPVPGSTDADRLATQMRLLGSNPNDLPALLAAGELSVKLDDLGAAASFFARADKVDPRNGRAKAGEGAILVHAERPGEALRYFALAESYGASPAAFAADRGLAYDLLGEQERAQRDYRLALRTAPDEETQRRYALSLAIAGKRELADQQLQPLLRQSDRGAWRIRAFVLAMGGNVPEATRIATTMMPPGTAAGLQPFLEKLPTLAPVDRAYAVHFGEVRSTPQRIADARLAPVLPALGPDPYAPRLAAVEAAAPADKPKRRGKESKPKRGAVQVAVASPPPVPLPQVPTYRGQTGARSGAPVLATRGAAPTAWPTAVAPPASQPVAAVTPAIRGAAPASWPTAIAPGATASSPVTQIAARPQVAMVATPQPVVPATSRPAAPPPEADVVVAATTQTRVVTAAALPAATQAAAPATPPVASANAAPAGAAPMAWPTAITPETPRPSLAATAPRSEAATAPAPLRHRDERALSGIIAGLPIPAAELGFANAERPAATRDAELASDQSAADRAAADKAARAKALADKRAADRKAAAEKKALAEKKAAAEAKAEEAREAAAQKKLERANPERVWVQVAGGAYEGDLPKAWAAVKAKGGDTFAGHATGWTTPLRATNRVLAGPFKTQTEARAFVNALKAQGLSAFTVITAPGQVVTKLPAK